MAKELKIKKVLKYIWDEFIYGGHLLSFGASGIVMSGALLANNDIDLGLILTPYLLSQTIYSFNHYLELKEDFESNPERANYLANKSILLPIIGYISLLISALLIYGNIGASIVILFILVFGILYPKKLTSKIIGFKNVYVAIFWALLIVFLGYYTDNKFELIHILLLIFVFLKFVLSTIFFDLKDIESDGKADLKTIPVIFGLRKTICLLNIINILSASMLIIAIYFGIFPVYSAFFIIFFFFYNLYYVTYGVKKSKDVLRYISYVVVDGEYILWYLILIISKFLVGP